MQKVLSALGTDFLFAKLHGMWAKALAGDGLRRLAETGKIEALARALAPLGVDVGRRAEVQRSLTQYLIGELASVMRLTDAHTATFYERFIERYFFENLKTILHYHHFPDQEVGIESLLIDSPHLPQVDADALLAARNVNQFYRHFPEHAVKRELLPILVELADTRDLFVAECQLDQLYYDTFLRAAQRLTPSTRGFGIELLRTEIDLNNLIVAMRNAHIYEMPTETVVGLFIPGGLLLHAGMLERFAAAPDVEAALAVLPPVYARILAPLTGAELYLSENALVSSLYRKAQMMFRDYNKPAASVLAFPFLMRFEVLNAGRVFEGLRFGLATDEILSMMIGGSRHA